PPAPPVAVGGLRLRQVAGQRAESRRQLFNGRDVCVACRAVERRRHAFESAHGITQSFEVGHGRLLLIESRREASYVTSIFDVCGRTLPHDRDATRSWIAAAAGAAAPGRRPFATLRPGGARRRDGSG